MLKTVINWTLNNYCQASCYYCPSSLWGGPEPRNIEQYLNFADSANKHFDQLGRSINWIFNGGEPLDMFDFPQLLKLCKRDNNIIELTTNGGKLWMDWWAIEPYVDILNLSFHHWQNPSLINYIIELYINKNKIIKLTVPLRHTDFDEDYNKAIDIETRYKIPVTKQLLIQNLDWIKGYYPYTLEQIELINGIGSGKQRSMLVDESFQQLQERLITMHPSFTGKKCNTGIEKINISAQGFASGSNCSNTHLGNIWEKDFQFIKEPQICKMKVCMDLDDQKIMKFD